MSDAKQIVLGTQASVIYGSDDRFDVEDSAVAAWRDLAHASTAALVPPDLLSEDCQGFLVDADTSAAALNICSNERFANQVVAAECSGVLVANDLVVTAAHCLTAPTSCHDYKIVFGFETSDDTVGIIPRALVYDCLSVLWNGSEDAPAVDLAILQLDRSVQPSNGLGPVAKSTQTPYLDQPVVVIGHPAGLPTKIDIGARIRNLTDTELEIDSDSFSGSSGSGVFSWDGKLLGVLTRGHDDYVQAAGEDCMRPRQLAFNDTLPDLERVLTIKLALDHLR